MTENAVPRRTVVALAGAAGALPLLAACGGGSNTAQDTSSAPATPTSPTTPSTSSTSSTSSPSGGSTQPALTSTSDVPVGGAAVISGESVVVTQPTAGVFKCFSSVCTHAGCSVAAGATLNCPCHGSRFSITDGSVLQGPAASPLPEKKISVKAGQIFLDS